MKILFRENETIKLEESRVELYKSCGWKLADELLTFKNKEEENNAWMERFGD